MLEDKSKKKILEYLDIERIIKRQAQTQLIQKTLLTNHQAHFVRLLHSKEFLLSSDLSEPNEDRDNRNNLRIWSEDDDTALDQLEKEPD